MEKKKSVNLTPGDLPDPEIKPTSPEALNGRHSLYHCATGEANSFCWYQAN